MLHGRLEWLRPEDLDTEQRMLYDHILEGPRATTPRSVPMTDREGRFHGPFNAMLVEPVLGEAAQALGAAVRYGAKLDERTREIAILEIARCHRSEFEFYAHSEIGRAAGLTGVEIEALAHGTLCTSFDEAERCTREVARSLVELHDLEDELYARAVSVLSEVVIADLVILVGFYEYTALALRVFRVPLPEGVAPRFATEDGRSS